MTVLGFVPVRDLEEEQSVAGVVLRHPVGFVVGLHLDPARARALREFAVLGLGVANRETLKRWSKHLDRMGVPHGPLQEGHLGWYIDVPDSRAPGQHEDL